MADETAQEEFSRVGLEAAVAVSQSIPDALPKWPKGVFMAPDPNAEG